ncbi:MAG: methyltransferase domain-containing protein [Bdellovibrionaceae bacterium]|nr:methyltransferase domain-containing protein [Pseudobdellovibrionaceae bacterium]
MNTGSYQFEKLESRHHEGTMLAERANMRLEDFPNLLVRHRFPTDGHILEVGTAQGIRAKVIAEKFPRTQTIGIDRSAELMAVDSTPNLKFQYADVYDLPFLDNTFDFVYARLVFMHLSDPLKALANIKRVLKPGGRILIEDADRDCMFFEPAPPSFPDFWKKVQEGQRRWGGDPNVGRKLAPLLKQAGFTGIQIETQPIIGGGLEIDFLVRTLMPSLNVYLSPEDRDQGNNAIKDLADLANTNPLATFYHFWFVVSGEKK